MKTNPFKKVEFVIGVNFDGSPMIHTIWIPR